MIVTLSGTDGSGKTTTAENLIALLREQGVDCEYRHEYEYLLLKYPLALLGDERVEAERDVFLDDDRENDEFKYRIWPYLVLLDALALLLWYRVTARRRIVLLDRFVYDQLISFRKLGVASRPFEWLVERFPRPDVALFFRVDPETAHARKRETHNYPPEYYERSMVEYEALCDQVDAELIDTSTSEEETLRRVLDHLLQDETFREQVVNDMQNNRTLRRFLEESRTESLREFHTAYAAREAKIRSTLETIETVFADIEWVLLKTRMSARSLPTHDVDILIREADLPAAVECLRSVGFRACGDEEEAWKTNFEREGLYKVSLHTRVAWEGIDYLDTDLIFENSRTREYLDHDVRVPDPNSEVLIHLSHMLFELTNVRKEDFDHLSDVLSEADRDTVCSRARANGWGGGCEAMLSLVAGIETSVSRGDNVTFPYPIPLRIIAFALLERASEPSSVDEQLSNVVTALSELGRFSLWRFVYIGTDVAVFRDQPGKT